MITSATLPSPPLQGWCATAREWEIAEEDKDYGKLKLPFMFARAGIVSIETILLHAEKPEDLVFSARQMPLTSNRPPGQRLLHI